MASSYDPIFEEAGRAWNVDPDLLRAVAKGESGAQGSAATSPKGAAGIMQLMPDTARGLGVTDVRDPAQNIFAGAKYLSSHLDSTGGDVPLSLRLYQGGPNRAGWGRENAAYPAYIMSRYQPSQRQDAEQAQPVAASGRDGVINAAVDRARQGATRAAPSVGHDAPDDVLLDSLTGGARAAPAPSGQAAPDMSDDALLGRLTAGAKPAPPPPMVFDPSKLGPVAQDAADTNLAAAQARDAALPAGVRVQNAATALADKAAPTATGVGNVLSATGQGIAAGFGNSMPGLAPDQEAGLRRMGVMSPASGGGTPMQALNDAGINALAPVVDVAGRSLNGLLQGYQRGMSQAGVEVGQPQLGRDLAALPEAFPFGGPGGAPRPAAPVNNLARAARVGEGGPLPTAALMDMTENGIPQNRLAGPMSAVPEANRMASAEAGNPLAAPRVPVTAEPLPPPGQPGSMGAAATPGALSNMTPAQEMAYRSTAEGQKLLESQPTGRDMNLYVPGVNPTLAQTEQSVNVSRELKSLNMTSPAVSAEDKALAARHNDARAEHFAGIAGSAVDVENARSARTSQAETNLAAAWRNKADANAQPVMDTAAGILNSPDGRRPAVRQAINSVTNEMTGPDGKLLTDPEMLYGVRKHIDDLLSKEGAADNPLGRRAQANLLQLKTTLDGAIEQAAPGFGKYLSDYAEASRPIDTMQALQGHEAKLFDAQNRMQYGRVQTMMRQIVDSRASDGLNPYKSIPDETMNNLFALRDDLRRAATEKELATTRGSDTAQNFMDVARLGGAGLLHAGIGATLGPIGNVAVGMAKQAAAPIFANRLARKQTARGMDILQPDRTDAPLRNPLAP